MSDIDTAAADSLKVLDPKRPIREADLATTNMIIRSAAYRSHRMIIRFNPVGFSCESRWI